MATFTALGDLGAGLGPMIMGFVLQRTSYPVMFACLTLTGPANYFYFYYTQDKKRKNVPQMTPGAGERRTFPERSSAQIPLRLCCQHR
jgi:hypothetical protein